MTHSSSLLPTVLATKQTRGKGDRRKASLSDHLDCGAMTDYKSDDHITSDDFTILVRAAIARHMKEMRVSGKVQPYLTAFVRQIMTQLSKPNPTVVMWVPVSRNPIVIDTGCREDGDRGCRRYLQKGNYCEVNNSMDFSLRAEEQPWGFIS